MDNSEKNLSRKQMKNIESGEEGGNREKRMNPGSDRGYKYQTDVEAALELLNFPMEMKPIIDAQSLASQKSGGGGYFGKRARMVRMASTRLSLDAAFEIGTGQRPDDDGQPIGASTMPKSIGHEEETPALLKRCDTDIIGVDCLDKLPDSDENEKPKKFKIIGSSNLVSAETTGSMAGFGETIDTKIADSQIAGFYGMNHWTVRNAASSTTPQHYCKSRCQNCIGNPDRGCEFCCQEEYLSGFSDDRCFSDSDEMKDILARAPSTATNTDKRRFVYGEIAPIFLNYPGYVKRHMTERGIWPMPHCIGRSIRLAFPDPSGRYRGFGNMGPKRAMNSSKSKAPQRPFRRIGQGLNYGKEDELESAATKTKVFELEPDEDEDETMKAKPAKKKKHFRL